MNLDDPFEQKLASLRPRDLPQEWRGEILARAAKAPRARLTRPPKWLLTGWGVAWAAVIALHFMTPNDEPAVTAQAETLPIIPLQERSQALYALLNSNPGLTP
jgi:hypothetical protein